MPHYSDTLYFDGLMIDVMQPGKTVIDQITSCELIVASSLDGIIAAEAYGIPAIWVGCNRDQLKYRNDYGASGRTPQPTTWAKALKMTSSPIPLPERREWRPQSRRRWQRLQ